MPCNTLEILGLKLPDLISWLTVVPFRLSRTPLSLLLLDRLELPEWWFGFPELDPLLLTCVNGASPAVNDMTCEPETTTLIGPATLVACGWISMEIMVMTTVNRNLVSSLIYSLVFYRDVTEDISMLLSIP